MLCNVQVRRDLRSHGEDISLTALGHGSHDCSQSICVLLVGFSKSIFVDLVLLFGLNENLHSIRKGGIRHRLQLAGVLGLVLLVRVWFLLRMPAGVGLEFLCTLGLLLCLVLLLGFLCEPPAPLASTTPAPKDLVAAHNTISFSSWLVFFWQSFSRDDSWVSRFEDQLPLGQCSGCGSRPAPAGHPH